MHMKVDIDTQDVRYADAWLGFAVRRGKRRSTFATLFSIIHTLYEGR
ncbi:hypothetical protein LNQ03_32160 [Klebsiella pneumoniae subsp. pneumoniae]|nr:hypothetical protein [Klebsiella pneumoniae subsp. pneumoniae]